MKTSEQISINEDVSEGTEIAIISKRKGIDQRSIEALRIIRLNLCRILFITFVAMLFLKKIPQFRDKAVKQNININIINATAKIDTTTSNSQSHSKIPEFNNINPNSDFCPYATCDNSPLCQPCLRRFIFIIAIGRTGSTTILNMLNMLPGVRLTGEPRFFDEKIVAAIKHLEENVEFDLWGMFGDWFNSQWHYKIPTNSLACPAQKFIETIDPPMLYEKKFDLEEAQMKWKEKTDAAEILKNDANTIIGFKKIPSEERDPYYFKAISKIFPCSRFIFSIRANLTEQAKSAWFHEWDSLPYLEKFNRDVLNFAESLGNQRSYILKLEEWKHNVTIFNELVEWLGFVNCKYKFIPQMNKNGYEKDEKEIFFAQTPQKWMGEECKYGGKET